MTTKKEKEKVMQLLIQARKGKALDGMDWDRYFAMMADRHDNETITYVSMAVQFVNLVQAADRLECLLIKAIDPENWDEAIFPVIDTDGVERALAFSSTAIRCFLREHDEESALIAADMIVMTNNKSKDNGLEQEP